MRLYIIASAESMEEKNYGYKLSPVARPFGEWVRHTTEMNYNSCALLRGMPKPDLKTVEAASTKEDLVKTLKESFEFCDPAFRNIADEDLAIQHAGADRKFFAGVEMIGLTNSLHEHYGNFIGYLRNNGVVPPSTVRTSKVMQ